MHTDELVLKDETHELEIKTLNDSLLELESIVDAAKVSVKQASDKAVKAKKRDKLARGDEKKRLEKVEQIREELKLASVDDVESSHGEAMNRLQTLAHAAKRLENDRAAQKRGAAAIS
eukprot:2330760-Pleurochrysis_carterae.AAC.1